MLATLAAAPLPTQAEAIRRATARSLRHRNRYTEQTVADLTGMLAGAEDEVRASILRYKSLGSLPDNQLAALDGLKKLQVDIRETMTRLRRDQTLRFRQAAKTSFRQGSPAASRTSLRRSCPSTATSRQTGSTSSPPAPSP